MCLCFRRAPPSGRDGEVCVAAYSPSSQTRSALSTDARRTDARLPACARQRPARVRLRSVVVGLWSVEVGLWSVEVGLWSVVVGLW